MICLARCQDFVCRFCCSFLRAALVWFIHWSCTRLLLTFEHALAICLSREELYTLSPRSIQECSSWIVAVQTRIACMLSHPTPCSKASNMHCWKWMNFVSQMWGPVCNRPLHFDVMTGIEPGKSFQVDKRALHSGCGACRLSLYTLMNVHRTHQKLDIMQCVAKCRLPSETAANALTLVSKVARYCSVQAQQNLSLRGRTRLTYDISCHWLVLTSRLTVDLFLS